MTQISLYPAQTLRITEIFSSLQGEANTFGLPTTFIRLTGCPLRCTYCDSAYAFKGGKLIPIADIMQKVSDFGVKFITVTGGEPLAQPHCHTLLTQLCDKGFKVSLETSGALDISEVDKRVSIVLDLKTPDSNECHRNLYENIEYIKPTDQIKFVICSRQDFDWALQIITKYNLTAKLPQENLFFSPSHQQLDLKVLADWIVDERAPVRLQVQLHKFIWGDVPGK